MKSFMFTDIESSTRLWEEHPEAMAEALRRHDALLSDEVTSAGGRVLKTTGDGMVAVFGSVTGAVRAATGAQVAMAGTDWGDLGSLRIRIGIHAGDAESRDGDFFGPVMNRAARIMAAAHGGQTLVSAALADLARDDLPGEFILRDLGSHRLKDLTLPEHLYQLVDDSHAGAFPPPLTLDSSPNNLPLQATAFLGRESELTSILALLDSPGTRLVTIAGPGGAGKTRLALQVAAEAVGDFTDGAFFVDLAAETDADAAFEAVVRALDLPSGGGSPMDILRTRLRDRHMLLVLDNFEQVMAAATGVAALLQSCPRLKIVVTSRETLRVRAEHVFPVPPLSLPDPRDTLEGIAAAESVQLFTQRARAVRPDFSLDEANAPLVARICLRLEGLPLAIELAAARLNLFTPADLLQRIQDRLDVLGAGGRDLPERQRTLWGAVAWSYELLEEDERRVFELMSVFSPTRLEAIEAVVAETIDVPDLLVVLASLVDKSLVKSDSTDGSRRFSMLLMIREFAAERLAENGTLDREIRSAHARYFCDSTRRLQTSLRGAGRQEALDELAREIGNLRTAWRFLVENDDLERLFSFLDGLWALHDARGWYHAAIELASDALEVLHRATPSEERAGEELTIRTSLARALLAMHGYTVEVEEAFRKVLEMAEADGGVAHQFPVLRALGTYYTSIADWSHTEEMGERLLQLAEQENDDTIKVDGHFLVGIGRAFGGQTEDGLAHLQQTIAMFDPDLHGASRFRLGPLSAVSARTAFGLILWQGGALDTAVHRVREALDVAVDLDHPFSVAYALYHHGFLDVMRGRFEDCGRWAGRLRRVAADNDYPVWATLATVLDGISLTFLGDVDQGLSMTETGVELYQGLTTPPVFWPNILELRAMVHARAGRSEEAMALIEEAMALGPDETAWPHFWITRAAIRMTEDNADPDRAEDDYRTAIRGGEQSGMRFPQLEGLVGLVGLRRGLGREDDFSDELRSLYDTFTEGHDELVLAAARSLLGIEAESMGAHSGS